MLSISPQVDPDPRKEIGLMTSYVWLTAMVSTSVICGWYTLWPVKQLLLADWLQAGWKRAKETSDNIPDGGESHEQKI